MAGFIPGVKNFPWKGRGLGYVIVFEIINPFNISRMDDAIRCGKCSKKWINYGKSHPGVKKIHPERGVVWVTLFKFSKCVDYIAS